MSAIYNRFKGRNAKGTAPWSTGTGRTYRVVLLSSTTFSVDVDDNLVDDGSTSDIASHESTNYTRQDLGTLAVSTDDTNNRAVLDSADTTFTALDTGQVDGLVVIEVPSGSTSDTANFPVFYNNSTAAFPFTSNGGNVTVQWSTAGLMTLS